MVPVRILIAALCFNLLRRSAFAATLILPIVEDTYIDGRASNQSVNYGNNIAVRVLINNNVTGDGSACRGLFVLPDALWTFPTQQVASATVFFYVWQDNTGERDITLHPLASPFAVNQTTWISRDGSTPWNTPGGDFDPAQAVAAVKGEVLDPNYNDRFFSWDITSLLNDPPARSNLQAHGALLTIDETPVPASGTPRAPFTSAEDASYEDAYRPHIELILHTIPPSLDAPILSDGAFGFSLADLTPGVTTLVERASNPASVDGWTAVTSFVANGIATNWIGVLPPDGPKAFFRARTVE